MERMMKQTRKTENIPGHLHRQLTLYAAAAGAAGVSALALAPAANAQIVYTPAHDTLTGDGKLFIDINGDGITDISLQEIRCSWETDFPGHSLKALPQPEGGGIRQGFYGAGAMRPGKKIGAPGNFSSGPARMVDSSSYAVYASGSWFEVNNRYLGVRFNISGATHYGWVRVNVHHNFSTGDINALVTGYAYQTQPDTLILAGDRGESASAPASGNAPAEEGALGSLALGSQARLRGERPPLLKRCEP